MDAEELKVMAAKVRQGELLQRDLGNLRKYLEHFHEVTLKPEIEVRLKVSRTGMNDRTETLYFDGEHGKLVGRMLVVSIQDEIQRLEAELAKL